MNKSKYIDGLLAGVEVEWKALGEIADLKRGRVISKGYLIENKGSYPVFSSQTANDGMIGSINTFDFDGEYVNWTTDGANAGTVFYRTGKFSITNVSGLIKLRNSSKLNYKFLYHWLSIEAKKHVYTGMGNPKLMSHQMEKIHIPIPPLKVQEEIVRILDAFTELTIELTTELKAELAVRKKQNMYYRDKLLTFENCEVEWKALREVSDYSKSRIANTSLNKTNYVGVDNLLQNRAGKTDSSYVPKEGNSTGYFTNDILIGNIRPYLKKIWFADRAGGTNGDVLVVHPTSKDVTPEFLYQVLANDSFFNYNMQHARGAKMPRGNKNKIMDYLIPIPYPNSPLKSLEEQARIVSILNKFDALTSSIIENLTSEIELRKKQYEYYRNLLLSFPKREVEA